MKDLEKVIREKVRPKVNKRTEDIIGMPVEKIGEDITSKLKNNILEDIHIDFGSGYRAAKASFRRDYLIKVLLLNLGNISEVAKLLGLSRRNLHRMISEAKIDVRKIKRELKKPYEIQVSTMSTMIGHVLEDYKDIIHPEKLKKMYMDVHRMSEEILEELPIQILKMDYAVEIFERLFLGHALSNSGGNITEAAKNIGIRFETMHRKMKRLRIKA